MIYLDFDGILFKSDYEPLLSSLAAFEINDLSEEVTNEIKAAYLLAKPSIRNVADLYTFAINNYTIDSKNISLQKFTDNIKKVRLSASEDSSVYQSFVPTAFFSLVLNWWDSSAPMLSILTSRDAATASTILVHYGFSKSVKILSSIELGMSKTEIIRDSCSTPFAIVDDMSDNLVDIQKHAYVENSLLIFGRWGYGKMMQKYPDILECSEAEAIASLDAWISAYLN
ncbi:MAG: hypothetical protein NTZ23_05370 [Cyanobium sp. LacPavin_0920_WC12_MAG_63_22]|nr:hypothetical protein [Cyanobium sp. LacPavin_0920_WC12_MAG_63_22]